MKSALLSLCFVILISGCKNASDEKARALAKEKLKLNRQLITAVKSDDIRKVKDVLGLGADVNYIEKADLLETLDDDYDSSLDEGDCPLYLAAKRGNIKTVMIPKENERELSEVPARITKSLDIKLVENVDEVLKEALVLEDGTKLFKNLPPTGAFCAETVDDSTNVHH